MSFIIAGIALAVLLGLMARSMRREKRAQDETAATRKRLAEAYGVVDAHVSVDDGSFVGLTPDGATLVAGVFHSGAVDEGEVLLCPITAIRMIEGMRDGVILVATTREGSDVAAAPPSGNPADAPERIHTLSLRITTDNAVQTVLFFQSGKHGVEPVNAAFRKQAAATEVWFRKLSNTVRAGG